MKHLPLRFASLLALVCLCGLHALGQGANSSALSGSVADEADALVPNASVTVKNNATGAEFVVQTADNGTFNVPSQPPGTYTVTVTAQGFKQTVVQDVLVELNRPASVNVALTVGAVTDTVTV